MQNGSIISVMNSVKISPNQSISPETQLNQAGDVETIDPLVIKFSYVCRIMIFVVAYVYITVQFMTYCSHQDHEYFFSTYDYCYCGIFERSCDYNCPQYIRDKHEYWYQCLQYSGKNLCHQWFYTLPLLITFILLMVGMLYAYKGMQSNHPLLVHTAAIRQYIIFYSPWCKTFTYCTLGVFVV